MRPEFLKRLLVLPVALLAACGGGTSSPTASTPVASTHTDPSTPAPSIPDGAALRDVVCKAAGCPADRTAVLAAAGQGALADLLK